MHQREAFTILEIEYGSSLAEARTAYRRLCIVWHPDRFQNDELRTHAEDKLKRINEAFATIKESASTAETSTEVDPNLVYQDLHCRYRGGDARLWDLAKLELKGRPCAVEVAPDGLLLMTFRDGQVDQCVTYSPDTFVRLSEQTNHAQITDWIRPADKSRYFSRSGYVGAISQDTVEISVRDPEGILKHAMTIRVTFRNDYYAALFSKRMRKAWGLIKPVPKPKPATKPGDPDKSGVAQAASTALVILGMLIIFIVLLALAADG